ncbi:MAG: M35 family metallo-endopeptidase, partial [Bacteriovoracaceae bacterium]
PEIIKLLNTIQGKIEPSIYSACRNNTGDVRIVNCGHKHSRVLSDYMMSIYQLNRLRNQVHAYAQKPNIRNNASRLSDVNKVASKLSCIRTQSDEITLTCSNEGCGPTTYALNPRNAEGQIQLCPRFFALSPSSMSATLIHEMSHDCGTLDFEYYYYDNDRVSNPNPTNTDSIQKFFGWSTDIIPKNADNFRLWAQEGFCLPGYDCRK